MFNGIIFNLGKIKTIKKNYNSCLVGIASNLKIKKKEIGCSISCNGVCLTLYKMDKKQLFFYVSSETIKRSNFKYLKVGNMVNLEKSLFYGQKISGNYSQGHVDDTAQVKKINLIDKSWSLTLQLKNMKLQKFLIEKASICINGVSLTVSNVSKKKFELNIIPHTLTLTNLKNLKVGDFVNVELDIFGKYMYKYNS